MKNLPRELQKLFAETEHTFVGAVIVDVLNTEYDLNQQNDYTILLRRLGTLIVEAAVLKSKVHKRN